MYSVQFFIKNLDLIALTYELKLKFFSENLCQNKILFLKSDIKIKRYRQIKSKTPFKI